MNFKEILNRYKTDGFFSATKYYVKCVFGILFSFFRRFLDIITKAVISFEKHLPLKNYIVFECESDMDDNPRAIYEYFIRNNLNKKYRLIWIVRNVEVCRRLYKQKNVDFVSIHDISRTNQIKLQYYLSTAKWFFFSHPYWFHKIKKEQVVVHTGHGTPVKSITVKDSDISDSFDLYIVNTDFCKSISHNFWRCPYEKMLVCGSPRNDYLLSVSSKKAQEIFGCLFEAYSGERVIICMATYKRSSQRVDSDFVDDYGIDIVRTDEQLYSLNEFLKGKMVHIIIKPHPLQIFDPEKTRKLTNIHYITNSDLLAKKIILYELIGCCDALITDFSSVFFDFLLTDKQIGFLMQSYENYERGFSLENFDQYMPGEKIYDLEQLKKFIIDSCVCYDDRYLEERKKINDLFNPPWTNNTEKLLKTLKII